MNNLDTYSSSIDRPGCVTVYALLAWFGAASYICGALFLAATSLSEPDFAVFGLILALIIGAVAILPVALGIGLWKMSMWGWWLAVTINGLGVIGGVLNVLFGVLLLTENSAAFSTLCGAVVGLAIYSYILYWFITNRTLFGSYTTQTAMGLDGDIVKERVRTTSFDTASAVAIVGVIAMLCLLPIFVIAILTLMGPQIGNVFSRIITDLDGTALPR